MAGKVDIVIDGRTAFTLYKFLDEFMNECSNDDAECFEGIFNSIRDFNLQVEKNITNEQIYDAIKSIRIDAALGYDVEITTNK